MKDWQLGVVCNLRTQFRVKYARDTTLTDAEILALHENNSFVDTLDAQSRDAMTIEDMQELEK